MLFFKECKQILKSVTYLIFVLILVFTYISQLGESYVVSDIENYGDVYSGKYLMSINPLTKPNPNQESYGQNYVEIPEQIMPKVTLSLVQDIENNFFVTYPMSFYKTVSLSNDELNEIKLILEQLTNTSFENLVILTKDVLGENSTYVNMSEHLPKYKGIYKIYEDVNYELFKEKMLQVDNILGGRSEYNPNKFLTYSPQQKTYEEALQQYDDFIQKDKISNAYARLYVDYMGIQLALFSIFVVVAYLMRDIKSKSYDNFYIRKVSSVKFIVTKYCAVVFMIMLPIYLISFYPLINLTSFSNEYSLYIDSFAYIRYITVWLLPIVLVSSGVGFFTVILTSSPIGIFIQFIFSFVNIFTESTLVGGYGKNFVLRHNVIGAYEIFASNVDEILINRIAYAVIGLILCGISIYIYSLKRNGVIKKYDISFKQFKYNKSTN